MLVALIVAFQSARRESNSTIPEIIEMKKDVEYIKEKVSGVEDMRENIAMLRASVAREHERLDALEKWRNEHA
jgi:hypothetical protein